MFQTKATWNYKIEWRRLKPQSHYYIQNGSYSKYHPWDSDRFASGLLWNDTLQKWGGFCCCFPWVKMSLRWSISATRAMVTSSRTKLMNMSFYNSYPITISWSPRSSHSALTWFKPKFERKTTLNHQILPENINEKRYRMEVSYRGIPKLIIELL